MKRFLAIVAFFGAFLGASAQRQMKDFILTMPDSLVKYLNTTKRTEMVDFYFMGVKAETFNLLSEGTVLDSLTANHADIRLNESARMQLHLLPRENGDTVVCMVRTFLGEAPESTFAFYDSNWKSLERKGFLPEVDPMSLIHRPDTMTVSATPHFGNRACPSFTKSGKNQISAMEPSRFDSVWESAVRFASAVPPIAAIQPVAVVPTFAPKRTAIATS